MSQKVLQQDGIGARPYGNLEDQIVRDLVREELRKIVSSRHFQTSQRGQQFLQYVVNQKNGGHGDLLKERLIGVEIFGRKPDYSTGEDPVVRVQAGDVRKRLERYYADPEVHSEIVIQIPRGSYAPTFLRKDRPPSGKPDRIRPLSGTPSVLERDTDPDHATRSSRSTQASSNEGDLIPVQTTSADTSLTEVKEPVTRLFLDAGISPGQGAAPSRQHYRALLSLATMMLLFALGRTWYYHQQPEATLKAFWLPASKSPKPVLLCLPRPMVYRPSDELFERYEKLHPNTVLTREARQDRFLPLDPTETIKWGDMKPVRTSGPGMGGVVAAIKITKLLTEQGIRLELRFGEDASYSDMRDSPVVIIGGINSDWATELTSGSAFAFNENVASPDIHEIGGAKRVWRMESSGSHLTKDYGLITRQLSGKTGRFLVQVAGISHFGTEAASEMLADPQALAAALRAKGIKLGEKNLQILVSTDITNDTSGPPHVVAVTSW